VHVGFALSVVDEAEARKIFEALSEMQRLEELEPTGDLAGSGP
jgi:hydrogenase maturation factor